MSEKHTYDVAIIEPNENSRGQLVGIAESKGYKVEAFPDALQAIRSFQKSLPRLIVTELLLPHQDGIAFCRRVRSDFGSYELPLLCISSLKWKGDASIRQYLEEQFHAGFLEKPFNGRLFLDVLSGILGGPPKKKARKEKASPKAPKASAEEKRAIGTSESKRTKVLTNEFIQNIANVDPHAARGQVRSKEALRIEFESLGELLTEYTENISSGGLFLKTAKQYELNEIIELRIDIPILQRQIEVQGRVVHQVSPQEAEAEGTRSGVGIQFVNLAQEDQLLLTELAKGLAKIHEEEERRTKQAEDEKKRLPDPPRREDPDNSPVWIVLIGVPPEPIKQHSSFLHRWGLEWVGFQDCEEAEDFLAVHPVSACVIHQDAFPGTASEGALVRLSRYLAPQTPVLVLMDEDDPRPLDRGGVNYEILDANLSPVALLSILHTHLGITPRAGPRVRYRTPVEVECIQSNFEGTMIDISCGGMLVRAPVDPLTPGMQVGLSFQLPTSPHVSCLARVAHSKRNRGAKESLVGLEFMDLEKATLETLQNFVESRVNFHEFFGWIHQSYFSEPESEE